MYDLGNMVRIEVPKEKIEKIHDFIPLIIEEKLREEQYHRDNIALCKRWNTGLVGEAAVEELLGIPIIDWTVGNSQDYNHPDIPGYDLGIKTVEYGYYPLINIHNSYAQIICIKYMDTVYVAGVADPDILNQYQSEDLVVNSHLRSLHVKTGFYGFDHVKKIKTLYDIKNYKIV